MTYRAYEEHKRCLQDQIRQKRIINQSEHDESKRYVKTHFGPEQTEERSKLFSDKITQERDLLRNALVSQIQQKRAHIINRSKKERLEDQKALEIIAQIK